MNKVMKNTWVVVLVVLVIIAGGYFFLARNQTQTPTPSTTTNTATTGSTIILAEQNTSGESGSAVLTEENGKVIVTLTMNGAPTDVPQPAHIHVGACPNVGAIKYPLTNVVNGTSVTVLDTTFAQLKSEQPLGLNVHKSVPEAGVYVSCGDLAL